MKRGGPLRADPQKLREWQQRSRKPLAPKSPRRTALEVAERRPEVREAVYERDGYRCRLAGVEGAGACFGPLTPHHVLKASQGGGYTLANLVTLCVGHNDGIEADADLAAVAHRLGLVRRRGDAA